MNDLSSAFPHALWAALAPELAPAARGRLEPALKDRALLADPQAARKLGPDLQLLDRARLTLLAAALAARPPAEQVALVEGLYRTGEQREQQSVLRALFELPDGARFCALAIEACRTNSLTVFAAIASDNPYPAAHFPELHFNQLVLKAIFLGVSVERIVGLERRTNPELLRMAREYASERRAAGRPVPSDVDHVIALCER